MKVTISDVAKLAGVSKSTVSRYINDGYVSEETRQNIGQIIKETKYEPNMFAQSLKAKQTNLIGVIVPRLNSYSVALMLKGIDNKLRELGYQMLISNTDQKFDREIESLYSFANQKVAGVILIATAVTDKHIKVVEETKLPILSVGQEHEKIPSLVYADEEAGYMIGKYVTSCGHRKIIHIGVPEVDIAVGIKRKKGFIKALAGQDDCQVTYFESDFLMINAKQLFSRLLKTEIFKKSTIVVCATDNLALGVMKAVREHGLNIPKDISITGYGNYEIADLMGLTTVNFPYEKTGAMGAQTIVSLGEGKAIKITKKSSCRLIIRESVDKI